MYGTSSSKFVTIQYTYTQEAFESAVSDDEMHRHIHICMYVRYMIIRVRDKSLCMYSGGVSERSERRRDAFGS